MKEVCPPTCLQSSAAAVRRPPPPLDRQAFGSCTEPSRQSAWAPPTLPEPSSPSATVSHRQPRELSAGMARRPCLASRIQFCWALFLMLKKNQATSQIRCFERNDSHPFLPPEPYGETWLQRHMREFLGHCSEKSYIRLPLPVCPPLQTQPWPRVLCRMLLGHILHSDGSLS